MVEVIWSLEVPGSLERSRISYCRGRIPSIVRMLVRIATSSTNRILLLKIPLLFHVT